MVELATERMNLWTSITKIRYPLPTIEALLNDGNNAKWTMATVYHLDGEEKLSIADEPYRYHFGDHMGGYDFTHQIYVEPPICAKYEDFIFDACNAKLELGLTAIDGKIVDLPDVWEKSKKILTEFIQPIIDNERKIHLLRLDWVWHHSDALGPKGGYCDLFGLAVKAMPNVAPSNPSMKPLLFKMIEEKATYKVPSKCYSYRYEPVDEKLIFTPIE